MKKYGVCAAVLLGAAAVSCWGAGISLAGQAVIPQGLSVGDRSLEGLTLDEALETVSAYVDELLARPVILEAGEVSASATAGELGVVWSNEAEVTQEVSRYENSNLLERYMMTEDLAQEPVSIPVVTEVSPGSAEQFIAAELKDVGQPAQDAVIRRENGEFIITPEVTGYEVDVEATSQALREALGQGLEQEIRVTAEAKETVPKVTAAQLEAIQDVLGTFSTDFSSSGAARSTNLTVGAGKINGHVLMPGETLSGYECLQPFTTANGYKAAASYENGRVVDSIGGGVCQISTTLYKSSLLAELEITQRQNHSMTVGYVKPSQDAAIAGTYKDLKVTNPYDTPIYVEGYTKGRTLTFTIYGQETRPENRTIRFQSETLQTISPGAPKEVTNASLAPGARVQIQSAHTGLKSRLWKIVSVDGVEQERTIVSSDTYNASPAIVQVGPPAAVPPAAGQVVPGAEGQPAVPGTEGLEGGLGEGQSAGQAVPGAEGQSAGQAAPGAESQTAGQTVPGAEGQTAGQTAPGAEGQTSGQAVSGAESQASGQTAGQSAESTAPEAAGQGGGQEMSQPVPGAAGQSAGQPSGQSAPEAAGQSTPEAAVPETVPVPPMS